MDQFRDLPNNKPKLTLALNGLVSVMVLCFVIVAIVSAAVSPPDTFGRAVGFAAIWNMLIVVSLNLGTYFVLLRRPSAESVAFLIGSTSVMMLQTLSLAVLFGGFNAAHSHPSWRAFVAFSVLLFMLYLAMTGVMVFFRHEIVDESLSTQQSHPDGTFDAPTGSDAHQPYAPPPPTTV